MKWDPVSEARRIVVFVTDAPPHIAGDGRLGGMYLFTWTFLGHYHASFKVCTFRPGATHELFHPIRTQIFNLIFVI